MSFFEASGKKLEIVVAPGIENLRERGDRFWNGVVELSGASILSEMQNEFITSYLLSESGLFLWHDRILMITCGKTNLAKAADFLIDYFGADNLNSLVYQRKNELRAADQPTSFLEDVDLLQKKVPGRAMRFGDIHCHHNLVFHLDKDYMPKKQDRTLEILMYDISIEKFSNNPNLENLFPGFQTDVHFF